MAAPREPAALLWLISLGRCALLGVPVRTPGPAAGPQAPGGAGRGLRTVLRRRRPCGALSREEVSALPVAVTKRYKQLLTVYLDPCFELEIFD